MGTAKDLTAVLDAWVAAGIREVPDGSNRTPIGDEFGWNGVAWCCQTMSVGQTRIGLHCFHESAVVQAVARAKAGTNGLQWIDKAGVIREGDMSCFQWNDGSHHISYVRDPGTQVKFQTDSGNENNRMFTQWRDRKYVMGFIRLPYATTSAPPAPAPPTPTPPQGDDPVLHYYRIRDEAHPDQARPGDNGIWISDGLTTNIMSDAQYVHGKNMSWYPKAAAVELVPETFHNALLETSKLGNLGGPSVIALLAEIKVAVDSPDVGGGVGAITAADIDKITKNVLDAEAKRMVA